MIYAPWTPEQVAALNAWQRRDDCHPFTCGGDHARTVLVATRDGWTCPLCDYTQGWAHAFMAAAAPVPDGERVREYERLKELLFDAVCSDSAADEISANAALDAFVLPLLAQPAASEWRCPCGNPACDGVHGCCDTRQPAAQQDARCPAVDSETGQRCTLPAEHDRPWDHVCCLQHDRPTAQQDALRTAAMHAVDAIATLDEDALGRHPTIGYPYRDELLTELRAALAATEAKP